MINHFVSVGMGFQMLYFFSQTDKQPFIDALTNSNYGAFIQGGSQNAAGLYLVALAAPILTAIFVTGTKERLYKHPLPLNVFQRLHQGRKEGK